LDFGNVPLGSTKVLPLSVTNSGSQSATVQVSQITTSGAQFKAGGVTPPLTLDPGQSVTINVTFAPVSSGNSSGSISIMSTASNPNMAVPLSGVGLGAGQLAVSPLNMNFSNVTVGSSQSQAGALTAGGSSVTVSTANWNGTGFSLSGISFPVSVPAGKSLPFTVTFAPQTAGSVTGTVSFQSNASNSPTVEQLSGTGVAVAQHSVTLDWNPSNPPVQGYYVYRGGQTGGPYAKISTLQANPPYADNTVASGQTYYYVVTALGNSQESGYSNETVAPIP
jgi:hypothetical protein